MSVVGTLNKWARRPSCTWIRKNCSEPKFPWQVRDSICLLGNIQEQNKNNVVTYKLPGLWGKSGILYYLFNISFSSLEHQKKKKMTFLKSLTIWIWIFRIDLGDHFYRFMVESGLLLWAAVLWCLLSDHEHMENLLGIFVTIILSLWLLALCVVTTKPERCPTAGWCWDLNFIKCLYSEAFRWCKPGQVTKSMGRCGRT